jgi:hypothetical protein
MRILLTLIVFCAMFRTPAVALEIVKVGENIDALVGELGQRSPTNLGNNATLAALAPSIVVPGHGKPAGLDRVRFDTRDCLVALREGVKGVLDWSGDMAAAAKIDQSRFACLTGAEQLAERNAQAVFTEMEFE